MLFVGYPRSGSTLVGSILNAHRHALVSQQVYLLRHTRRRFSRRQLLYVAMAGDQAFANVHRRWSGYDYAVPNQHQGVFARVDVVGDRAVGGTTRCIRRHPDSLVRFRQTVRARVRLVHVIRNPFDNITTIAIEGGLSIAAAAAIYTELCDTVLRLENQLAGDDIIDVHLAQLIGAPEQTLTGLCRALSLDEDP